MYKWSMLPVQRTEVKVSNDVKNTWLEYQVRILFLNQYANAVERLFFGRRRPLVKLFLVH